MSNPRDLNRLTNAVARYDCNADRIHGIQSVKVPLFDLFSEFDQSIVSFRQECVTKIIATHSGSRSGISPFRRASA